MLVEMQIEIFDGQSSGLFSNEPFEKRSVMTIEDFVLHSDDHFESHLLRNGLYLYRVSKTHRIPYLYRSFSAKVTYI